MRHLDGIMAFVREHSVFRAIKRLSAHARSAEHARLVVAAFYYFVLYLAVSNFFSIR